MIKNALAMTAFIRNLLNIVSNSLFFLYFVTILINSKISHKIQKHFNLCNMLIVKV